MERRLKILDRGWSYVAVAVAVPDVYYAIRRYVSMHVEAMTCAEVVGVCVLG